MSSRAARDLVWGRKPPAPPLPAAKAALGALQLRADTTTTDARPTHELPLSVHAHVLYLLHLGAEIEHALMVEYLYAAFSLGGPQVPAEHAAAVDRWRKVITEIAREEMGHLATVENLLQLVGGPLCFEREDFPNPSPFYPFPFEVEPLTRDSLAKYVLAEAPPKDTMTPELRAEIEEIERSIGHTEPRVNRVGELYSALIELFKPTPPSVAGDVPPSIDTADIIGDSIAFQASGAEWGLGYQQVLILQAHDRTSAIAALTAIAVQGEGASAAAASAGTASDPSHFARFLAIYREFPRPGADWSPARPQPSNPTTRDKPFDDAALEAGRITDPLARRWAQLGNVRYAMLLGYLAHAFETQAPTASGERTSRGLLISWAFGEMYNLRSIGDLLGGLPLVGGGGLDRVAGLPFEMPYTLALPQREPDRWRVHRDCLITSRNLLALIEEVTGPGALPAPQARYVAALRSADHRALEIVMTAIGR